MTRKSILNNIKKDKNLLPLTESVSSVLELTAIRDYSTGDLAHVILKNPSLAAAVVALCNTCFSDKDTQIGNINQAISAVGGETVKCLALATSILNSRIIPQNSRFDSREFFTHIFYVATVAQSIARLVNYEQPAEALVAGLLHDVGSIYFLNNFSNEYAEAVRKRSQGMSIEIAENAIFGINHGELNLHLARTWKLPKNITRTIGDHHDYDNIDKRDILANIIKLSIVITFDHFSDSERDIEKKLPKISNLTGILKINHHQIAEVSRISMSRIRELAGIFGVEVLDPLDLLAKANREIWRSIFIIERLLIERKELTRKVSQSQRIEVALEARNEALSTLSHYLNNSIMIISGQSQLISLMRQNGQIDKLLEEIPSRTDEIKNSVDKISVVMDILKEISPLSHDDYFSASKALNIDYYIAERMRKIGLDRTKEQASDDISLDSDAAVSHETKTSL